MPSYATAWFTCAVVPALGPRVYCQNLNDKFACTIVNCRYCYLPTFHNIKGAKVATRSGAL
jgi:hypothetical protein